VASSERGYGHQTPCQVRELLTALPSLFTKLKVIVLGTVTRTGAFGAVMPLLRPAEEATEEKRGRALDPTVGTVGSTRHGCYASRGGKASNGARLGDSWSAHPFNEMAEAEP